MGPRLLRASRSALVLGLSLGCLSLGCPPRAAMPDHAIQASHARFAAFTSRFLRAFLEQFPTEATALGDHRFDATWPDESEAGDQATLRFLDETAKELESFPPGSLDEEDRADASILKNRLEARRFNIVDQKDSSTAPMFYSGLIGDGLDPLVNREFAPLEVRMKSLKGRLEGLPALVAVAKKRLQHSVRVNTETAIVQTKGLVDLCERNIPPLIARVSAQGSMGPPLAGAVAALKDFGAFLEGDLLPRSDGSFRAGPLAFAKILRFQLDDPELDPDALVKEARAAMATTRLEMLAVAEALWPTIMTGPPPTASNEAERRAVIRAVLDKLAEDHADDATVVGEAKAALAEATAFVGAHDLVRLPDETVKVIEMPEYKRGFSTAYCDSTGPLEAVPETFVAISQPPADWPAERRASQYREYNRSMLKDLLVHEAMPGHYLQTMHANRFKSDVRAVFDDGAFVEGWAVYGEWLMAKHGFGGPKVKMEQLKMLLRTETNAVLDHEIHAGSLEEAGALALMRDEAFQEEGEAVGKWRRARLSRGQLTTYYYGFRELMKLREQAEREPGFRERAYNDRLLSFGSPPLRIIRERMSASTRPLRP